MNLFYSKIKKWFIVHFDVTDDVACVYAGHLAHA